MSVPVLNGLVLAGGDSRRMQTDKAAIQFDGQSQLKRAFDLLARHCSEVFISVRRNQAAEQGRQGFPQIHDVAAGIGPAAGILAALDTCPDAAWLICACDLPMLDDTTLENLIRQRDQDRIATAYQSSHDGLPEPLCAIYEPSARPAIHAFVEEGLHCPRKMLIRSDICLITQPNPQALDNINTPDDLRRAREHLGS